jgi:hypothetical protein
MDPFLAGTDESRTTEGGFAKPVKQLLRSVGFLELEKTVGAVAAGTIKKLTAPPNLEAVPAANATTRLSCH